MSLRLGMPVVMVAALSIPLVAQTRPNLAGKWEMAYEKSTPVRPAPTPPFPPMTIAQDANTITISGFSWTPVPGTQERRNELSYTSTYVCDGVEHPEPDKVPPLPPAAPPQPSRPGGTVMTMTYVNPTYLAAWSGSQLVLTTRATSKVDPTPASFVPRERVTRKTYSIDSGGFLVVESLTTENPAPAGPAPTPARSVYRKIS
jgi:hypothetical protein